MKNKDCDMNSLIKKKSGNYKMSINLSFQSNLFHATSKNLNIRTDTKDFHFLTQKNLLREIENLYFGYTWISNDRSSPFSWFPHSFR